VEVEAILIAGAGTDGGAERRQQRRPTRPVERGRRTSATAERGAQAIEKRHARSATPWGSTPSSSAASTSASSKLDGRARSRGSAPRIWALAEICQRRRTTRSLCRCTGTSEARTRSPARADAWERAHGGEHSRQQRRHQEFQIVPVGAASSPRGCAGASDLFSTKALLQETRVVDRDSATRRGSPPNLRATRRREASSPSASERDGYRPGRESSVAST